MSGKRKPKQSNATRVLWKVVAYLRKFHGSGQSPSYQECLHHLARRADRDCFFPISYGRALVLAGHIKAKPRRKPNQSGSAGRKATKARSR